MLKELAIFVGNVVSIFIMLVLVTLMGMLPLLLISSGDISLPEVVMVILFELFAMSIISSLYHFVLKEYNAIN